MAARGPRLGVRWAARVAPALARRPTLWPTALRQVRRLAPRRWWSRPPFLPVPDRGYLGFRLQAMYGDPRTEPRPEDLITYLRWCRELRRVSPGAER